MRYIRYHLQSFLHGNPSKGRAAAWLFADACSATVLIIGVVSLAGYFFDVKWMHDGWFKDSVDMAPQTALGFTLTGCALLFIHRAKDTQL